jgi:hypothetical protein
LSTPPDFGVGAPEGAFEVELEVEVELDVEGTLVLVAPALASVGPAACGALVAGVGATVGAEDCELTPHAARTEAVAPPNMSLTRVRRFIPSYPLKP